MLFQILFIDDNKEMLMLAEADWKKYGGCIKNVRTLQEAIDEMLNRKYHLIAISSEHVKEYLLPTIKSLREITSVPILILVPDYHGAEKIAAILYGADEYLPMPDITEEGVMSGMSLIRRNESTGCVKGSMHSLAFKDIEMDLGKRKVYVGGNAVELSRGEFNCLELLMAQPGKAIRFEALYFYSFGEKAEAVDTIQSVRSLVKRIRGKLGDDCGRYLQAVRGVGYTIDENR